MYLLGYDIGSSSIKAALVDVQSGKAIRVIRKPISEMNMITHQHGWAEQHPDEWWKYVCLSTKELLAKTGVNPADIKGIGISYQMHGLVLVDNNQNVLRPAIIWCDSRAVEIGDRAYREIGEEVCLTHLLNSPGNFTASKLKWIQDNEPDIYDSIYKMMLPGDYIAMKLTGEIVTTVSGLSEGIFWDFKNNRIARHVMDYYGFDDDLIPEIKDSFCIQGRISKKAAEECGLVAGIPVTYRAGDQPNNALSLGVLSTNQVAASGGTSGVVYGLIDSPKYDPLSRVNAFAHVSHTPTDPQIGILLCINGSGIQYSWTKHHIANDKARYDELDLMAAKIPIGSEGLIILPFGNGAERILLNKNPGAQIKNLHFNVHRREHIYRSSLEGIAFSFYYGFQILKDLGLNPSSIKVGNDNLFQSDVFSTTISNLMDCEIEILNTTGAIGAGQASGIGAGVYADLKEATSAIVAEKSINPEMDRSAYLRAYDKWQQEFDKMNNNYQ